MSTEHFSSVRCFTLIYFSVLFFILVYERGFIFYVRRFIYLRRLSILVRVYRVYERVCLRSKEDVVSFVYLFSYDAERQVAC